MDAVNKTLYIPLYGKALVSGQGLFLRDPVAQRIWSEEGFSLRGKSASKWLAYYMGIRAAVFDDWVRGQLDREPEAVVIHIGCGLDSRAQRVGTGGHKWYDLDFPEVIRERRRYFSETEDYRMLSGNAMEPDWLESIPEQGTAVVVMEGVSMYLPPEGLEALFSSLSARFDRVRLLMDCYTVFAAKASKYKNPINDVGVTRVYGLDDPETLQAAGFTFVREHDMTPRRYIDRLSGMERAVFQRLYAGKMSQKLYRLYEYRKD